MTRLYAIFATRVLPAPISSYNDTSIGSGTDYALTKFKWADDISIYISEAQTVGGESGAVRDLIAFQQNILVILAEEPMYGLVIKRHLESYCDIEVNYGRPYPNLDDFVEMGLVEKSGLDKWTNQYELTGNGPQAVLDCFDWMLAKFVTSNEHAEMVSGFVRGRL